METMELDLVRVFVKVIQNGSFSRAAEVLKAPKSTVSKAVTRLERETGTKLLLRTTRSLSLTPAGKAFYDACLGPVQAIEDAQKSLYGQDSILSGMVRITAPEDLGNEIIAPAVGELVKRHPALFFELNYTDEIIDLVKEGFDVAVRIGRLMESGLKVKRIGKIVLIPVASPQYLKSRQKIAAPRDLERHDCLFLSAPPAKIELHSGRETVRVPITLRIRTNQTSSLLKAAEAGAGVAFVPSFFCREEIETGKLVRVLPQWKGSAVPVSLLSPLSLASSVRLKVVGEYLSEKIRKAL